MLSRKLGVLRWQNTNQFPCVFDTNDSVSYNDFNCNGLKLNCENESIRSKISGKFKLVDKSLSNVASKLKCFNQFLNVFCQETCKPTPEHKLNVNDKSSFKVSVQMILHIYSTFSHNIYSEL